MSGICPADRSRCSSISFYWAMDGLIPQLNAHNIFLVSPWHLDSSGVLLTSQAEDYKESFDDIFRRKSMPKEPSFYVNVPSRVYVRPKHTCAKS
jgi:phytoene desaturase (3,4-didehydrolycopene-forming)